LKAAVLPDALIEHNCVAKNEGVARWTIGGPYLDLGVMLADAEYFRQDMTEPRPRVWQVLESVVREYVLDTVISERPGLAGDVEDAIHSRARAKVNAIAIGPLFVTAAQVQAGYVGVLRRDRARGG